MKTWRKWNQKTPLKNHQKSSPVIPPGVNRSRVTQMNYAENIYVSASQPEDSNTPKIYVSAHSEVSSMPVGTQPSPDNTAAHTSSVPITPVPPTEEQASPSRKRCAGQTVGGQCTTSGDKIAILHCPAELQIIKSIRDQKFRKEGVFQQHPMIAFLAQFLAVGT